MTLYIDIPYGPEDPNKPKAAGFGRADEARPNAQETNWEEPYRDNDTELMEHFEAEQPGAQLLQRMDDEIREEDHVKVKETAQNLYQSAGQKGEGPSEKDYDYEGLVREGGAITPDEKAGGMNLPNAHIQKNKVEVFGYDLSTGQQVRDRLPDPEGLVAEGIAELHQSQTNTVNGHPIEDTAALAKIGVEHVRNGGTYAEFKAQMPKNFTDDQMSMAYRVADDYVKKQDLMDLLDDESIPAPQDAPLESWDLTDEDLRSNDLWMNAARVMYRNLEGEEFSGEDEDLYELSLEMMSEFGWNAFKMAHYTQQVMNGPDDMKRAMYVMMTMYENKDTTRGDVLNNVMSLGTDPFTYLGLTGVGVVAVKGAQLAAKKALSATLVKYIGAAAIGSAEGAAFLSLDDWSKQMVEIEAGAKTDYDKWQTAQAAGTGAATGLLMGPAFVFGGEQAIKYGKDLYGRVREMRANPDPVRSGPIARQRGAAGFEPTDPDLVQGKALSIIDIMDNAPDIQDPSKAIDPSKQVGEYFRQRSEEALAGRDVTKNTPANKEFLAKTMAAEALAEMQRGKRLGFKEDAAHWYSKTLDEARRVLSDKWPEIVKDARHRSAFDFALAITSNGQKVNENMVFAANAYKYWRETGRMPTSSDYGNGKEANAMVHAFKTYNDLIEAWGEEAFLKNMATEFRVGDMKAAGFKITDEGVDARLPLSVIFGSKIGGGFYSNLQGDWDRLTPDRWFARTWGRYTNTMFKPAEALKKTHDAEFRDAYVKGRPTLEKYLGKGNVPLKRDLTPELIDELGLKVWKRWSRAKGADGKAFPDKSNPMHTLSRSINNRMAPREGPRGAKERQMMRETTQLAVQMLRDRGHDDLTVSGLQAILWYLEQRIWDQLGSRQIGKENNYAKAARNYLGLPTESDVGRGIGDVQQAGREAGLGSKDARKLIARETARNLRVGSRGQHSAQPPGPVYSTSGRVPKSTLVNGASVEAIYTPRKNKMPAVEGKKDPLNIPKSAMDTAGIPTEPWSELAAGPASDKAFRAALLKSKKTSGKFGPAVYVYDEAGAESLETATKFMTADGKAGFAIKLDGDIVSVFNTSGRPGSALSALMLAVEKGGTKLDAFDAGLGDVYAQAGFKVVKREKWNEEYKPQGWDKKFWGEFAKNGEPDIIYMEYDPQSHGTYTRGEGDY